MTGENLGKKKYQIIGERRYDGVYSFYLNGIRSLFSSLS